MMGDVGTKLQTNHLSVIGPDICKDSKKLVSVVRFSPDGRYLAHGDDDGQVIIRQMGGRRHRLKIGDVGAAVRQILFHPTTPCTLLIASTNGHVNFLQFQDKGYKKNSNGELVKSQNHNIANKVPGFISALAISPRGKFVAVGYETRVKLIPLPLIAHDGPDAPPARGPKVPLQLEIIMGPYYQRGVKLTPEVLKQIPIRHRPLPRSIHFLDESTVLVSFLAGVQAFKIEGDACAFLWDIPAPMDRAMGSTAINAAGDLLAATNMHSGIDWYSLQTKTLQMTTTSDLGLDAGNFILELAFIDHCTVVSGQNKGILTVARHGSSTVVDTLGREKRHPMQSVAVVQVGDGYLVAGSCGVEVFIWTFEPNSTEPLHAPKPLKTAKGPAIPPSPGGTKFRPRRESTPLDAHTRPSRSKVDNLLDGLDEIPFPKELDATEPDLMTFDNGVDVHGPDGGNAFLKPSLNSRSRQRTPFSPLSLISSLYDDDDGISHSNKNVDTDPDPLTPARSPTRGSASQLPVNFPSRGGSESLSHLDKYRRVVIKNRKVVAVLVVLLGVYVILAWGRGSRATVDTEYSDDDSITDDPELDTGSDVGWDDGGCNCGLDPFVVTSTRLVTVTKTISTTATVTRTSGTKPNKRVKHR